jgi:hypothetical protein
MTWSIFSGKIGLIKKTRNAMSVSEEQANLGSLFTLTKT